MQNWWPNVMLVKMYYRIRANRRPAAYKQIRVLWWWLIAIFSQNSPKMPQKGGLFAKKVVAY